MRYAPWAMALALCPVAAAGSAHAGRSHTNVAVVATFGVETLLPGDCG